MIYYQIPKDKVGKRIAERLLALKDAMESPDGIPPKSDDAIILATWNIREFDSPAYGQRTIEPLYYIAEILSHFDLIAVQEVREDLKALEAVRNILGGWWKYIVTDVTEGSPGNRERIAFLYDSRKVRFGNVAGEVVIPPVEKKSKGKKTTYTPSEQLYRTPFICGFKAGWSRFMLCTVHIVFGEGKADDHQSRPAAATGACPYRGHEDNGLFGRAGSGIRYGLSERLDSRHEKGKGSVQTVQ